MVEYNFFSGFSKLHLFDMSINVVESTVNTLVATMLDFATRMEMVLVDSIEKHHIVQDMHYNRTIWASAIALLTQCHASTNM